MHGIALGHKKRLAVLIGNHAVLAVRATHENALGRHRTLRSLVLAGGDLDNVAVKSKFCQIESHRAVMGRLVHTYRMRYLFVVESAVILSGDIFVDSFAELFLLEFCFS